MLEVTTRADGCLPATISTAQALLLLRLASAAFSFRTALLVRSSHSFCGQQTGCLSASCMCRTGLLERESNAAVTGGVNIMLSAKTTAGICQLQALSVVGRCRTFDSRSAHCLYFKSPQV